VDYKFPTKYREYWKTKISRIDRNEITIRGYPLEELSGRISYTDAIVLCLRGEIPGKVESNVVNAVFTAAMDHQFLNTTVLAARTVVSANPDPVAGIAAGVLSFGRVTAGVPSFVVELLQAARAEAEDPDDFDAIARTVVHAHRSTGRRIPGFGHPLHDMRGDHYTFRSQLLHDRVAEFGLPMDEAVALYERIHTVFLGTVDKPIPINVDGLMGAVFTQLDYTPVQVHALAPFTMLPGIVAHVVEEIEEGVPLRIVPESYYVGEPDRHRGDLPGAGERS
jgi:citrate synthase